MCFTCDDELCDVVVPEDVVVVHPHLGRVHLGAVQHGLHIRRGRGGGGGGHRVGVLGGDLRGVQESRRGRVLVVRIVAVLSLVGEHLEAATNS